MWADATFRFCASGAYGFFYSDWLKAIGNCVFVDVGANLGIYSLVASKNPNIKKIYAFEPQPDIFKCLNINLKKNLSARVIAFPCAISEVTEESELRIKDGHSGTATLRMGTLQESDFSGAIKIKKVNYEFLDLEIMVDRDEKIAVKIDTEGHEEQVLAELMKTKFWGQVFNVFYEVDERYVNQEKILNMLHEKGFSVIRKIGKSPHYDLMLEKR
jgi:FkbM family methyltransferase